MRPLPWRPPSRLGVALIAALALAACGRRGPLELPPGAPPQAVSSATSPSGTAAQDRVLNNQDTPGLIQSPNRVIERSADAKQQVFQEAPAPPPINASPPTKPTGFILDPLL